MSPGHHHPLSAAILAHKADLYPLQTLAEGIGTLCEFRVGWLYYAIARELLDDL